MISEKEQFLNSWDREFQTTLKVIKAYPMDRENYKPHEKSKSAKDLAWTFTSEEMMMIPGIIAGNIDFTKTPAAPANIKDILSLYEKTHKDMIQKIKSTPDTEWDKKMKFMVGPNKFMDIRKMDILWMLMMDQIHHRGQLTVYIRLAGGKIPSVYGPTADETWNITVQPQIAMT